MERQRQNEIPELALNYVKHLALAWAGASILALLCGQLISAVRLDFLFGIPESAPFFGGYLMVGALLGYLCNREASRAALFVFLPPLMLLLWDAQFTLQMPVDGGWAGVWTAYFSRDCGMSECGGEIIEAAPLACCVGYALGAWCSRWRQRTRPAV